MAETGVVVVSGTADPALLDDVHAGLARLWEHDPQITPTDRLLFETAVAEVAANVVSYTGPGTTVELRLAVHADRVEATFTDDGAAAPVGLVDTATMPGPDAESGRGLATARAALDELAHRRDGGTNHWHLVRRASTAPPSG